MAGGINQQDEDELDELADINITPFIDVMLVLLIIFMVAAPLSTVDVPVDLPVSAAKPEKRPDKPLFVTIKADRTLAVGEADVSRAGLIAAIDTAVEGKRDSRIFVRADKTVPYGELMTLLNQLRLNGYLKVALVGLEGVTTAQEASAGQGEAGAPAEGR